MNTYNPDSAHWAKKFKALKKKNKSFQLVKYSEDQPRDERGRFTSGGGGSEPKQPEKFGDPTDYSPHGNYTTGSQVMDNLYEHYANVDLLGNGEYYVSPSQETTEKLEFLEEQIGDSYKDNGINFQSMSSFDIENLRDYQGAGYEDWNQSLRLGAESNEDTLREMALQELYDEYGVSEGDEEGLRGEFDSEEDFENAVEEYMQNADEQINMYSDNIESLDRLFAQTPAFEHTVVTFRGSDSEEAFWKYETGDVIKDPAFASTSLNPNVAEEFGEKTMVVINPPGTTGIAMNVFPQPLNAMKDEREVLLPRNSTYEVVAKYRDTDMGKDIMVVINRGVVN